MPHLRVLVVPDASGGADLVVARLRACEGVEVIARPAGQDASAASLVAHQPDVAVVVLGQGEASGLNWVLDLAEARIPVVAVLAEIDGAAAAWDAGAHGLLVGDMGDSWEAVLRAVAAGGVWLRREHVAAISFVDPTAAAMIQSLTDREIDILRLVAGGLSNKAIAGRLGLSASTVGYHLGEVYEKLGVHDRASAVWSAARLGVLRGRH